MLIFGSHRAFQQFCNHIFWQREIGQTHFRKNNFRNIIFSQYIFQVAIFLKISNILRYCGIAIYIAISKSQYPNIRNYVRILFASFYLNILYTHIVPDICDYCFVQKNMIEQNYIFFQKIIFDAQKFSGFFRNIFLCIHGTLKIITTEIFVFTPKFPFFVKILYIAIVPYSHSSVYWGSGRFTHLKFPFSPRRIA